MDKKALTKQELIQFLKDMELGTEQTVMAIDGEEDDVMPDLAMGVIKDKYFDSDTSTFLVGVYGSDCNFQAFFSGDYDDEDECLDIVTEWLTRTADGMCNNFGGLYIKSTDKEEQEFYEENKYNGEIARTIDTLTWGKVDLVSRFDIDEGVTFYDCYQKDGGGYLGEFRILPITELDEYTDKVIEASINTNIQTGW